MDTASATDGTGRPVGEERYDGVSSRRFLGRTEQGALEGNSKWGRGAKLWRALASLENLFILHPSRLHKIDDFGRARRARCCHTNGNTEFERRSVSETHNQEGEL